MIELNKFKKILNDNEKRLPLLTLDEFFNGNTEEDSIAPNQWEFGRPTLAEIWDMLQKIERLVNLKYLCNFLCISDHLSTVQEYYACL